MNNNINLKIKASADGTKNSFDKVKKSLTTLNRNTKETEKGFAKLYNQTRKNNNSFSNMTKDANRLSSSLSNVTKGVKGLGSIFNVQSVSAYMLGRAFVAVSTSAIDMIETTNLFNVAMGDMAVTTQGFVDIMSEAFGLDATNIQSSVGTYNLLARSMGMSSKNAQTLSTNTNKLALDLSSLTNVPINQVMQDLRSGLLGQSETVYKYGMDVTEASLKTEAMAQGITKSVRDMSQGEKMALRYSVMIKQSGLAHGDFAKTINTPANQLKIMTERFVTLTRAIGTIFMPTLEAVLPYVNALLTVLTKIVKTIATLVGYEPPPVEDTKNGFSGMADDSDSATDSINDTTKAIKNMNNAFGGTDELNILSKDTGAGASGDVAVGGAMDMDLGGYDNLMDTVKQKSTEIATEIEKALGVFSRLSEPLKNIDFNPLATSLGLVGDALATIGGAVGETFLKFYEKCLVPAGVWAMESLFPTVLETIGNALSILGEFLVANQPMFDYLIDNILVPIGSFVGDTFVVALGFVADALGWVSDWIADNQWLVSAITLAILTWKTTIEGLTTGIKIYNTVSDILTKGLGIVKTAFGFLTSPVGLVILAIGALVIIIYELIKHWDEVKAVAEVVWEKIKETWFAVGEWFNTNVVEPLGTFFTGLWDGIKQTASDCWEGIKTAFKVAGEWFSTNITEPIKKFFVELWDGVKQKATECWDGIKTVFKVVTTWFKDNLITPTIADFTNLWNGVKNKAVECWDGIKGTFIKVKTWFKDNVTDPLKNGFKTVINGFIGLVEGFVNRFISGVNKIIGALNKLSFDIPDWVPVIGGKSWGLHISTVREITLPRLAKGGMLERGQMFEAGEFGKAEMIGSYQGKTTVMPLENSGFVEAIHNAVFDAVTSAQSSGGQVIENVLNLDGEVIYRNQQKVSKSRGYNIGLGAFA